MTSAKDKSPESTDFIRAVINEDLRTGKHGGKVVTRFPPEPNGYLHIGHSKSICLNFGIAEEYGGTYHLRFDDTDPTKEDVEYVEAIKRDIQWLGFDWGDQLFFASDYYERLFDYAVELIESGYAYVDSIDEETMRAYRGTVTEPGKASAHRDRSIAENLDLFGRMRAGEFDDGAHVLRAKIDMASPNMKMRDPPLYRIRKVPHYRQGDAWCIYPLYDFTHCLSDSIEGITHSICTLEFENNRELYDWILDHLDVPRPHPRQYEFARLNLTYTMMSKRRLLALVQEGHVDGWDDPRMPTLAGYRRRGYTPEAIRGFLDRIGVARANSIVDVALLEFSVRDDLNHRAPRVLAVLRPLKVVIENYPEGESEDLDAPYWPHDVPREGTRKVPFSREIYIEGDDFAADPPKGFYRLAPGREVRLRYAYVIKCVGVDKNDAGEVTALRCTYDPDTRGGSTADGRKIKGTIHWVSAREAFVAPVRLYDRLFVEERPDATEDFHAALNPESLETIDDARLEPSLRHAKPGDRYQFERNGYFFVDPVDSSDGAPVFNRTVPLRDSWAKATKAQPAARRARRQPVAAVKERLDADNPVVEIPATNEDALRYRDDFGLSASDALALSDTDERRTFFAAAIAAHHNPGAIANWMINELPRALEDRPLSDLPFDGGNLGRLIGLIDDGTISGKIAKNVFVEMMRGGADPATIVADKGLEQVADANTLEPIVDAILAGNATAVARYRDGNAKAFGFFVGQVMARTGGKANPKTVNELLRRKLDR